ncbi:hypothetical protein A3L09_07545 [Thermococcus profundus]|uniref:DUF2240 domain-containing protein n=1 Tax=Thermococcus profundus TaxID=49899 RepID=A0A2Z2MEM9_THEPR|nr:DUF2240 family protein [Thermococcus profundus]ASJ03115.1 hypothetical protein A3L09_07545 [Thermococcus profundus]
MHPIKSAVTVKGSGEFSRSELVGILAFKLRLMSVSEAKRSIEEWLNKGLLEADGDTLKVRLEFLNRTKESEDLFEEMVSHVASALEWERADLLEALDEFSKRYGNLDKKLVLYLFGLEKGVNMEKFKDRLELE